MSGIKTENLMKLVSKVPESFRIWDLKHKRWFQGKTDDLSRRLMTDSLHFFGETMLLQGAFVDQNGMQDWAGISMTEMLNYLVLVPATGLYTEDQKQIFNGDFLETIRGGHLGLVIYNDTLGGYVVLKHGKEVSLGEHLVLSDLYSSSRIVGNIFENPELVERM